MDARLAMKSHDKKTLARVGRLRDAALKIRALLQAWQPGVRVSSAQRGQFRIRYQDPATECPAIRTRPNQRTGHRDTRAPFGLEIAGEKPLLRTAWDGDDAIVLTLFERGHWETEFLRLASPTKRPRR
jgi:hypothetical protein